MYWKWCHWIVVVIVDQNPYGLSVDPGFGEVELDPLEAVRIFFRG